MSNKALPTYPGIGPVVSYGYDMNRASLPPTSLGPLGTTETFLWMHTARLMLARVLWGLYQFKRADAPGTTATVEGAILLFPIYDFCGGLVASSATATVYPSAGCGDESAFYRGFRPPVNPPTQDANALLYTQTKSPDFLARTQGLIPDVGEYTGQTTHTLDEALAFMRKSLAAGVVSYAIGQHKRGIFAADRVDPRTSMTRAVMAYADRGVQCYTALPSVTAWAGQHTRIDGDGGRTSNATRSAVPYMRTATCEFSGGETFYNENSGNQTSMCSTIIRTHSPFSTATAITHDYMAKFIADAYLSLAPQSLLHN